MKTSTFTAQRYSTKVFDANRKISAQDWAEIQDALRQSPSSVNIQPWHFIIADDDAGKARIAKAFANYPFNANKVIDASHVVVFACLNQASDEFLKAVLAQEDKDGRYATADQKKAGDDVRRLFLNIHREELKDEPIWFAKQVYLNLGFTLMAAAALGVDSVPMEGADFATLDAEFGLSEKGYHSLAVVAFGYRAEEDFNAKLPKSRLTGDVIFTKA
ncbi:oxygen-insensitive NAD(P)H nitroreductase [Lonepinella sp. BR2919]|uniref:oxygen-insensitive NAD(P)H nitroreductase n=1 Tax=unclassified Lonepinella TaxID=2642006 RepID=UPI003F6DE674